MSRPSRRTLQQRLAEGVVLGAEGYVFELERRGYVKAGPFVPEVILDEPAALRQLHRELLRAGADVMVALTYYAHRGKLADIGRSDDLEEMNRQAVRIANEAAAEGEALVAGNICNTWLYDPADPVRSGAVVRAQYEEQLGWAVEEGVDFVIAETNDYVGEALIGLEVCQELGLPAMVTFASVQPEKTYDGYDYVDACRILADRGATIVGLNCSRGPETMLPLLEAIRGAVDIAVAAQPVPYRTSPAAQPSKSSRPPTAATSSRSNSSRSSAPGSRWPISHAAPATSASTTSASAAAAGHITSARWPRRSGARRRPAVTRPTSRCIPSSGRQATGARRRSWAAGRGKRIRAAWGPLPAHGLPRPGCCARPASRAAGPGIALTASSRLRVARLDLIPSSRRQHRSASFTVRPRPTRPANPARRTSTWTRSGLIDAIRQPLRAVERCDATPPGLTGAGRAPHPSGVAETEYVEPRPP